MVVIDGLIAVDGDEVLGRISRQFTIEVGGSDHCFLIFGKAASRIFYDGESRGHHLVECLLVDVKCLFLQFVYLVEYLFAFVDGCVFDGSLEFGDLVFLFFGRLLHVLLYFFGLGAQLVIAQRLDFGIFLLHLFHERLNEFHVTRRLVSE